MLGWNRRFFNLAFLIVFLAITASVNLCHTETGFGSDPTCPACHFHNSCLATAVIHFFQLPVLSPVEIMENFVFSNHIDEVVPDYPSRSPPRV